MTRKRRDQNAPITAYKVFAATVRLEVTYLIPADHVAITDTIAKERFLHDLLNGELPDGELTVPTVDETSSIEPRLGDQDSLHHQRDALLNDLLARGGKKRTKA